MRFNPFAMLQAFMMGNEPACQPLTMETIDANNNKSQQTQYVATTDIRNMNPCWFQNETNPVTGASCRRAFQSMVKETEPMEQIPEGVLPILFLTGVSGLSLFLLYKMCKKMK